MSTNNDNKLEILLTSISNKVHNTATQKLIHQPPPLTCKSIHSIRIKNFCSVQDVVIDLISDNLTTPLNIPLTLFTGPNNSGKSNIFKALWFWNYAHQSRGDPVLERVNMPFSSRIEDLFFNGNTTNPFSITLSGKASKNNNEECDFKVGYEFKKDVYGTNIQWSSLNNPTNLKLSICYLPGERDISLETNEDYHTWSGRIDDLFYHTGKHFRTLCFVIQNRFPQSWELIKKFVRNEFLIQLNDVKLGQYSIVELTYKDNNGYERDIMTQGSRLLHCLATLARVSLARSELLLLDEPDGGEDRQLSMLNFLLEHDKMLIPQLIICIHSEHAVKNIYNNTSVDNTKLFRFDCHQNQTFIYSSSLRDVDYLIMILTSLGFGTSATPWLSREHLNDLLFWAYDGYNRISGNFNDIWNLMILNVDNFNRWLIPKYNMVIQAVNHISENQKVYTSESVDIDMVRYKANHVQIPVTVLKDDSDNKDRSSFYIRIKRFTVIDESMLGFHPSIDDLCFYYRYCDIEEGIPMGINEESFYALKCECPQIHSIGITPCSSSPSFNIHVEPGTYIPDKIHICCGESLSMKISHSSIVKLQS